jgi:hypothetical protein
MHARTIGVVALAALIIVTLCAGVAIAHAYPVDDGGWATRTTTTDGVDAKGEVAYNGKDYSKVAAGDDLVLVCDEEADGNVIKGEFDIRAATARTSATFEVADDDGANGRCASAVPAGIVLRHRVCERNHLFWHCGNWQVGT